MTMKVSINNPHALQPRTTFEYEKDGCRTSIDVSDVTLKLLKKAIKEAMTEKVIDSLTEQIVKHLPELFSIYATEQPLDIDVTIVAVNSEVRVTTASARCTSSV